VTMRPKRRATRAIAVELSQPSPGRPYFWFFLATALLALAALIAASKVSRADEGVVSFWLPGLYGSLAAVPQAAPGWSLYTFNYYDRVSAGADVSAAREVQIGRFNPTVTVNLSANLNAKVDLQWVQPNYAFATPVLGGQLMVSLGEFVGWQGANLNGTLTATVPPFSLIRSDSINSSVTGFSDMYPVAALRWHDGVNNYLIYGTGDIPVGAYKTLIELNRYEDGGTNETPGSPEHRGNRNGRKHSGARCQHGAQGTAPSRRPGAL
jgi:hypothetical protein